MTVKLDGTTAEVLNADPLVIKNQKSHFHIHSYGGWSKFFVGLREGKLLATRCTNAECDDLDPCTTDVCSGGSCSNTPISYPTGQICVGGTCQEQGAWCAGASCTIDDSAS